MENNKKQFWLLIAGYALLRVFSFVFGPSTPLHSASLVNSIVTLVIVIITGYLLLRRDVRGWYLVLLELVLGGAGGFLAFSGISLRTWLLIISLTIFFLQLIKNQQLIALLKREKSFCLVAGLLYAAVALGALTGILYGHDRRAVISDALPYLFLLYYFPAKQFLADAKQRAFAFSALTTAIIGNAIFIVLTFTGFSSNVLILQDAYYHWYRDVALGKITELPFNFYRLVLNEHLLLIPALIYYLAKIIKQESGRLAIYLALLLLGILSINLTRIYILGLAIGLLVLFQKIRWKRWLITSALTGVFLISIFTSTHLMASRGQSLGWEIFGIRLQSIVSPRLEDSSLSRLLLLPKILEKIYAYPLFGTGLGDTLNVFSPIFKKEITTSHFDWGYLEIMAELGVFGALAWLIFIGFMARAKARRADFKETRAILASFAIINITSPAFFHVLGFLLFALILAL